MKKSIFLTFVILMLCVLCLDIAAATPLLVDGTAATANSYASFEEAIAALPSSGGEIIVCGDTTVGDSSTTVDLPAKSGKVTVTGQNGAKLIIARGMRLGCEMEFDDIELVNSSSSLGYISAKGNKLTIGEGVTTSISNSNNRWLTIYGSSDGSETVEYDTHVVVKAGKYRYIFGGGKGTFKGDALVEVSGVTVEKTLSAKNEKGTFSGTGSLVVDLRGNKTVTAGTYAQTPTLVTDSGYSAVLDGNTYSQVEEASADAVYVDGTGATSGAYTTLEAAIAVLPSSGGEIIVCGDTTVGDSSTTVDLPAKSGKVTVTGQNGAKLIIARGMRLGCEMEFDDIVLANSSSGLGYISAKGNKLTIGEGVTTSAPNSNNRYLTIYGSMDNSTTTDYDTHVIVKSGTWRHIFGGGKGVFNGSSATVEVSGITVTGKLSAKNEEKSFNGSATLIVNLKGNKTVTAATFVHTPEFLVDVGYSAVLNGTTYSQVKQSNSDTVYVDGTGATSGAYTTLEAAIAVLPSEGGEVIVCGDTTVGTSGSDVALPAKDGKVIVTATNGAKLKIARGIVLGGETEFDDIEIVNISSSEGYIAADGNKLTIGENVVTSIENTERWLTILGGNKTDVATEYDSHVIIKAGTYRYIYGGNSKSQFDGNSTVEVSNITVTTLSAKCEKSAFNGSAAFTVNLCGNKTVTVTNLLETPEFVTDDGYRVVVEGNVYSQAVAAASTVYVDGTGATAGAYSTLEEAVSVLPNSGGTVIVCGDTEILAATAPTSLSIKSGKVVVSSENGAKLTIANDIILGSDLEFANATVAASDGFGAIRVYGGLTLTVGNSVDIQDNSLVVELGKDGTAVVDNANVTVVAADAYELVVTGNVYKTKVLAIGFISNATGNDKNDGLSDQTPKALQGSVGGNGIRNLLDGGGLLIVCGNFNISDNNTWDYGGKVTVTGSYKDKDYKDYDANTGIFKLKEGKTITVVSDLTFEDILFYVDGGEATVRVSNGATFVIGENVEMINSSLNIEVEEGGTAIIKNGQYVSIKGDGNITVEHCAHENAEKDVAVVAPTCTQQGIRYNKCKYCGLYIGIVDTNAPLDPDAHKLEWAFGETSATATCINGCGYSVTQVYTDVTEIHVSSKGTLDGDLSLAKPINDFGLAMAFAAAQDGDVTIYIHDYAVIPNSGAHSSWNAYVEPAHTNTITVSGYRNIGVLRFNNESKSNVLVYALSGPTVFENLEFSSWGSAEGAFYLVARHNKIVLGEDLTTDIFHKGSNEFNVIGGCFYKDLSDESGCKNLDTDVTILSGNYTNIYAGAYYNEKCCVDSFTHGGSTYSGGDVHLTIGGRVSVRRQIRVGNHGDSSTYANMNDAYIDIVGSVVSLRYFIFGPSKAAYKVKNVYLRLYDGEVRVGDELGNMNEFGYEWGSAAYGEPITERIAEKLYVFGNSESVSAMGMYEIICANLSVDSANDGKWEASVMDETYCDVNRGAHTPVGNVVDHADATCNAEGYDIYVCSACGTEYAEKISKIPHVYGSPVAIAATCVAPEMARETCSVCGSVEYSIIGDTYADHTDSEKTGLCQVCNADLTLLCEHRFDASVSFNSGCGVGTKRTCALCGKVEVDVVGDSHNYGAYTITVAPTASTAGVKTRTCKSCGKVETALVYSQNTMDASAFATNIDGSLADFSVESTKLSKAEKAVLNELLQQDSYGSEVKISYETDGDTVKNIVYMIPVPKEYSDYENIRVVVRDDNGEIQYVHFEIEKGYIVFVF